MRVRSVPDNRPYLLARHVYPCATEDYGVVLDLRRDRYLAFGRFEMAVLSEFVRGWPREQANEASVGERGPHSAEQIISGLLSQDILVTDPQMGKAAQTVTCPEPGSSLITPGLPGRPRLTASVVCRFLWTIVCARVRLRRQSIESVVASVAKRRARAQILGRDIGEARELVLAFMSLRPVLFAGPDACVLNAVALLDFLAWHGWYPSWVWGVKSAPFSAHCWVQEGQVVLNDLAERVRGYTPILVI
jgi:hypothetical protein